jgi:radical SAM superfamily enzyme YgiQ (UPF0313 family)
MRIVLLYPPPWKIAAGGEDFGEEGPPEGYREGDLDPDFHQIPYGLLSLGAQAARAGHEVKVLNLSAFPWKKVEETIAALDADLFGMSCWTANRRGVFYVARLIKEKHPRAHVTIGGPHATPLARECLVHWPEVDTVCVGESERTFLELAERVRARRPMDGLAGAYYRSAGGLVMEGPPREAIHDLDELACPHDYFDAHVVMTSRGCPWACTFCGAETTWGRGFRGHSVPWVLDMIEAALARAPVKMLQIKDDTFTANKKRALEISRGIRERGLRFLWSCDTRVDVLTEDLLREMRLAGCVRMSLGVESGSDAILSAIQKKITTKEIEDATRMAKKFGIQVRFYMMLGNRGETVETFQETLAFLDRVKPHQYLFSCLSIYPGTTDFNDAEKAWLDRNVYFRETFQELKAPFDASPETTRFLDAWFAQNRGVHSQFHETVEDYRAILERLPDFWGAELDLGGALFRERRWDEAEAHVRRALELGHPAPGLCLNYLACIAAARGDLDAMMDLFTEASKVDPQHWVLLRNVDIARRWFKDGGPEKKLPLSMLGRHDFKLLERTRQPTLPGPLPADFAEWKAEAVVAARPRPPPRANDGRKLRVVGA